jgi:hypothetical protein
MFTTDRRASQKDADSTFGISVSGWRSREQHVRPKIPVAASMQESANFTVPSSSSEDTALQDILFGRAEIALAY